MQMRKAMLLLSFATIITGRSEESAEHKNRVDTNSGSESSNNPPENETSRADTEQRGSEENTTKESTTEARSADSGETKTASLTSRDRESNAEAMKKTIARIDPNAILKVEIKISKTKSGSIGSVSSSKSSCSKQDADAKDSEENRDSNVKTHIQGEGPTPHNAESQSEATANRRGTALSSVSYRNDRSADSGGGFPIKKQIIEVVPCKPRNPAPTSQAVSAALPHSDMSRSLKHLENFEGGLSVLCVISKNINLIKEKIHRKDSIGRIRDVLVLKNEDDDMRDYWGRLKFQETGGAYVDETGFYEGRVVGSAKEVLESGKLTKNGFYQSKDLPEKEVEEDFQVTKFLLNAISKEKGVSVTDMVKENCDLPLVDKLLFARRYTSKQALKKETVCICVDGLCKEPCKEIRQVDAKKLE